MSKKQKFDFVIVGAGFAGLSTAFFLSQKKNLRICILEKASAPGKDASGRNASMMCRISKDPVLTRFSSQSAELFWSVFQKKLSPVAFQPSGSLFTGYPADLEPYGNVIQEAQLKDVMRLKKNAAVERFPFLKDSDFKEAFFFSDDGICDIEALIHGLTDYVKKQGCELICNFDGKISASSSGYQIDTPSGSIFSNVVVNAAGAWAGRIASGLGAQRLPVFPTKRHLFLTHDLDWVQADWPIVWDITHEVYCRPSGNKLILSPCDEKSCDPWDGETDDVQDSLEAKLNVFLPRAKKATFSKIWSGLRTFSPDGRFVIGWDAVLKNLFWVACLDGHGLSNCASVGHLASQILLNQKTAGDFQKVFSPDRFL
jgi:D-arginine dehydrogenase